MQITSTSVTSVNRPAEGGEPQAAPEDPWAGGGATADHDPLVSLALQTQLHGDLKQLVDPRHGGVPNPAAPMFLVPIVVMAPGPFVQRTGTPDKIGGPNAPVLEAGKSSGPIVADLQGKLNMWKERQWRDLEGRAGWPTGGIEPKGKFDRQTTQALKEFQKTVGLPPTGVADAVTQNLLKLESDPRYWSATTQADRLQVRKLMGSLDAVSADAVARLLDSSAFHSPYTNQAQAIAAVVASRGDAKFAESLGKLLGDFDFKSMDRDDRSALLRYLSGHADARTADALLAEVKEPAKGHALTSQAMQEWTRHVGGLRPAEVFGRNSGTTPPLTPDRPIPRADWAKPETIVGQLTQVSAGNVGPNAYMRCGPSSVLAGALLRGKDAAAQLLDKVADNRAARLTASEVFVMHGIANKLRSGDVSFSELSLAQDLLYRAASTRASVGDWRGQFNTIPNLPADKAARLDQLLSAPRAPTPAELREMSQLISTSMGRKVTAEVVDEPLVGKGIMLNFEPRSGAGRDATMFDGGIDDTELQRMLTAGGMSGRPIAYPYGYGRSDAIPGVLSRLGPGESAVVHIPLTDRAANGPHSAPNHFISVGVMSDGRPYIYNPAPQQGDATLVIGRAGEPQDPAFASELERYNQRANGMDKRVLVNALKSSP